MTRMDTIDIEPERVSDEAVRGYGPGLDADNRNVAKITTGSPAVAKAPPAVPIVQPAERPANNPSAEPPASVPPHRRLPTLRTMLMAGGILAVAIGAGVVWLHGGR